MDVPPQQNVTIAASASAPTGTPVADTPSLEQTSPLRDASTDASELSSVDTSRLSGSLEAGAEDDGSAKAIAASGAVPIDQIGSFNPPPSQDNDASIPTPGTSAPEARTPQRGGRGGRPRKRTSLPSHQDFNRSTSGTHDNSLYQASTPNDRIRGRGRGGRPRGRGRGRGRGQGRLGKRKREDDDDDESSDSDEITTPLATVTKSGRSISKPTTFVPPPPPSPPTTKRKRFVQRRNPENAVCKVCLRGSSPLSNMIVFCDGCNSPYHRYCHKPLIEQAVIDEVDREWHCRNCEADRVAPVPQGDVASFVSVGELSVEQRQRYFSSLPFGMLVTLLTKATTMRPDLPLFSPAFRNSISAGLNTTHSASPRKSVAMTGAADMEFSGVHSEVTSATPGAPSSAQHEGISAHEIAQVVGAEDPSDDESLTRDQHPSHYPAPGRGLMSRLPPDRDDSRELVDEDDAKNGVYKHLYILPNKAIGVASTTLQAALYAPV